MNASTYVPHLKSVRARKARLGYRLGPHFYGICLYLFILLGAASITISFVHHIPSELRIAYFSGGISLVFFILAQWYKGDLAQLPARGAWLADRLSRDVLCRLSPHARLTPQVVWRDLKKHWQLLFITNHLLLSADDIETLLSTSEVDMPSVWEEATRLADAVGCHEIEPGHIAAAILRTSSALATILSRQKLSIDDVDQLNSWLGRSLAAIRTPKPYFGGIGRDWANGFTPMLNTYGENVSLAIERYGAHFSWLMASPGVQGIKGAFSQGAAAIALIGEPGVGKTSHVYALAQSLLQESHDHNLEHRQIVSLNPSLILSDAHQPGALENTIVTLLGEAIHAGHIILFFDDAQLFFKEGVGSFDITQVLLPIIQARRVQIGFAMTPSDYQQLKAANPAFAGLLTPVVVTEPQEADTMRILEDSATGFEAQHKVLITYDSLRDAYRLSGRYEQDMAYPGKAIRLLEQSLVHARDGIVTAEAVQAAVEQAKGVKVGSAKPAEAEELLHLEDKIHERMINQSRAVSVVANALRRARAGVADPKRPIGSFLFLGPTGVGKTELARSIADVYFGSETNMIRLDMSEYQQASDVTRLLSNGRDEQSSLIMSVRQQPFSVILLDEIEKAHPNILNLLLQLLDEGKLTDSFGRAASFKDAIIIATSNAGANSIRERVERGEELESFEKSFIDELISSNQFKPELLNRFDEIVLFRPLKPDELVQLIALMMNTVNTTLASQNISVELTQAAAQKIVSAGYDPRLGARPLRRELQRTVEDTIAARILSGQTHPGDHVILDESDLRTNA